MKLGRIQQLLKSTKKDYEFDSSKIVIDGRTYFQGIYKEFGCDYIFGGEYDRYADHLKKVLNCFKQANIKCYVVFNGSVKADINFRLQWHEKILNQVDSLTPENKDNVFSEPALLKDVNKQVLDELNIDYMVCEHDNLKELLNTAKYFRCPVITKSIEYALFGISCISPKSLLYDAERKSFAAKIYEAAETRQRLNYPQDKLAIFLVLLNEENNFLNDLRPIIRYPLKRELNATLVWIKRHTRDELLSDISKNLRTTQHEAFLKQYNEVRELVSGGYKDSVAVNYFAKLSRDNMRNDWFIEGITKGYIAIPYVTLKNYNLFSGSWLCYDKDKSDAMLSVIEILRFVAVLMSKCPDECQPITFVGRDKIKTSTWQITVNINEPIDPSSWRNHAKCWEQIPNYFEQFLNGNLPYLDWEILNKAPEESRLLIISLIYYGLKINQNFLIGAHCVLLCFVMLGAVSKFTGVLKRSNFLLSHCDNVRESFENKQIVNEITEHDSHTAANAMMNFFYVDNPELKKIFDRKILHVFAEFQHCLQHLNYLNKFCGEKMKGTVYHQTYNATFVYKMFVYLKEKKEPMMEIEKMLKNSPSVFRYYNNLVNTFRGGNKSKTRFF